MFLKVAVPGGGRTTLVVPVIEHPFFPNHFFPPANTASMRRVSHVAKREGAGVSCTTAKQTFAINRGEKLLLPISVLKSKGLGEESGEVIVQLLVVHIL